VEEAGLNDKDLSEQTAIHTCLKCDRTLPLTSFIKNKTAKSGYGSKCKECKRAENLIYYHSDEYREYSKKRRQTQQYKDYWKEYMQSPKGKAAFSKSNIKFRKTDRYQEWFAQYKQSEKGKARDEKYRKSDKCKATYLRHTYKRRGLSKDLPSTLTSIEWEEIKKKYKYRCVYCGEKKPLTRDHLIPLSKGGGFTKENIVPACKRCNSIKNNHPVLLQLLAMDKPQEPVYTA